MKMNELRMIAKNRGIDTRIGRSKQDIIREIQLKEGNTVCFNRAENHSCSQEKCWWRQDCNV